MLNVRLRRARGGDAEFVDRIRNQPSSLQFQASPARTVEHIRVMLDDQAAIEAGPAAIGKLYWVIEVNGTAAGLLQLDVSANYREQGLATLGYTVAEDWQGRGIATAAVRAAIVMACDTEQLAIERIEAVAAVENLASRRVLETSGFQFEGVRRGLLRIRGQRVDHACYGILNTDLTGSNNG